MKSTDVVFAEELSYLKSLLDRVGQVDSEDLLGDPQCLLDDVAAAVNCRFSNVPRCEAEVMMARHRDMLLDYSRTNPKLVWVATVLVPDLLGIENQENPSAQTSAAFDVWTRVLKLPRIRLIPQDPFFKLKSWIAYVSPSSERGAGSSLQFWVFCFKSAIINELEACFGDLAVSVQVIAGVEFAVRDWGESRIMISESDGYAIMLWFAGARSFDSGSYSWVDEGRIEISCVERSIALLDRVLLKKSGPTVLKILSARRQERQNDDDEEDEG